MIAQVKEELRQNGSLMENTQTVFKAVRVNKQGEFRPAMSEAFPLIGGTRIVYTPSEHYKVGVNFLYPAFAFYHEAQAREFVYMQDVTSPADLTIVSFVAYQWAWMGCYMWLSLTTHMRELGIFWSSDRPFTEDVDDRAYTVPHGTLGLFEFEVGDVIYGG